MTPKQIQQHDIKAWQVLNEEIVHCELCPRLVAYRQEVARKKRRAYQDWDYWAKPVPGFGAHNARILVVGLAPGAHGSNRTGRMFTGDASGDFLFPALHRAGFANQPISHDRHDGLLLTDLFISAAARCAPPGNKPLRQEILTCRPYLLREMALLENLQGFVALGQIAFGQILQIYADKADLKPKPKFAHAAFFHLGKDLPWLLASYHPSQQNTQTGRLTQKMFDDIWEKARDLLRN
jgi:uracil-DNA glycosylase family 4